MEEKYSNEEIQKRRISLFSLVVSIFLVTFKIAIAYLTNSLGVYSEALNNGLDLVAVFITFFAVRVSTKPADKDHPYGHGKYENFSALLEITILFVLCFYIIFKSIGRLIYKNFELNITWYTFLILIVSMALNVIRVTYIGKAAKKYNSPILKSNFINYTGDIFSSLIVLTGLYFARRGAYIADPISSMIVSILIIGFSSRLAFQTIKNLLGYVPKELTDKTVNILAQIPELKSINQVKIHQVGNVNFINLDVSLKSSLHLSQTEKIKEKIRKIVSQEIPGSEVAIETTSCSLKEPVADKIKELLLNLPEIKDVHNIFVYKINDLVDASIHIELNKYVKLEEAENLTKFAEKEIKKVIKNLHRIYIHIECVKDEEVWDDVTSKSEKMIANIKKEISRFVDPATCHNFSVLKQNDKYHIAFHCRFNKDLDVERAHQITTDIENQIKNRFNEISEIVIHVEPAS
ncbi:MAG: cation diffusion facilitator family transporter [Actinobacteria bacterium]|nr:cation diffusion facilitator family transporter [Actinomycetota bacterium]